MTTPNIVYRYPANSNRPKGWTKVQWLLFGVGIGMWAHWAIVLIASRVE